MTGPYRRPYFPHLSLARKCVVDHWQNTDSSGQFLKTGGFWARDRMSGVVVPEGGVEPPRGVNLARF